MSSVCACGCVLSVCMCMCMPMGRHAYGIQSGHNGEGCRCGNWRLLGSGQGTMTIMSAQQLEGTQGYVYTGAFYFMYGFKAIAFYPVHTNPFMFVYGRCLKILHFQSVRAQVTMTLRTWPQEGKSIYFHPFTCLYENSISVGIHCGRRFQISPFWIFV